MVQRNPRFGRGSIEAGERMNARIQAEIDSGSRIGQFMLRQDMLLGPYMDQLLSALASYRIDGTNPELDYDSVILAPAEARFHIGRGGPFGGFTGRFPRTLLVVVSEGPLMQTLNFMETEYDWAIEEAFLDMLKGLFGPSTWYDLGSHWFITIHNNNADEVADLRREARRQVVEDFEPERLRSAGLTLAATRAERVRAREERRRAARKALAARKRRRR